MLTSRVLQVFFFLQRRDCSPPRSGVARFPLVTKAFFPLLSAGQSSFLGLSELVPLTFLISFEMNDPFFSERVEDWLWIDGNSFRRNVPFPSSSFNPFFRGEHNFSTPPPPHPPSGMTGESRILVCRAPRSFFPSPVPRTGTFGTPFPSRRSSCPTIMIFPQVGVAASGFFFPVAGPRKSSFLGHLSGMSSSTLLLPLIQAVFLPFIFS